MTVDSEQCMGHGRCYRLMPDLLTSDDEGYVTLRDQTLEIAPDQYELAEDVEATFPEGAISLIRA